MPDEWVIVGNVTRGRARRPVAGVRISVVDVDGETDAIGAEVVTDEKGDFEVRYGPDDFPMDMPPAIFLRACDEGGELLACSRRVGSRRASRRVHLHLPDLQPTVDVDGFALDKATLENLDQEGFLAAARLVFGLKEDAEATEFLRRLSPELELEQLRGLRSLTPILELFRRIIEWKEWSEETERDLDRMILTATEGTDAFHDCDPFKIHYSTAAVFPADAGGNIDTPGGGQTLAAVALSATPAYIQRLCFWLKWSLDHYTSPPLSLKDPADFGEIEVFVTDATSGYDPESDTFKISDGLPADKLAMVAAHELMHVVQARCYNNHTVPNTWKKPLRESGAVLIEDALFDKVNRYIWQANHGGALSSSWQGATTGKGYKACLLLKYLAEQQSASVELANEPKIGVETYRALLEECAANGYSTKSLRSAITGLPWYQTFHRFKYLDPEDDGGGELDETSSETLLGNFWLALYLKDFPIANQDQRFSFKEAGDKSIFDTDKGTLEQPALGEKLDELRLWGDEDTVSPGDPALFPNVGAGNNTFNPFSALHYKVNVDAEIDTLRLDFKWDESRSLVQAVLIEEDKVVRDILRSDKKEWSRTIANERNGKKLNHILVVVAGGDGKAVFDLALAETDPAPDVMVTKWHHVAGTHYEINSKDWAWTWVSPDIWVDNNNDNQADDVVNLSVDNKLKIRLRNQGHADAEDVEVEFWYQDAAGGLSDDAWQPVKDQNGAVQKVTGLAIAAGTEATASVNWAPAQSGTSTHFCIRAAVTSPGDPNTDNKRCLSNFGNVLTGLAPFNVPMMRHDPEFRPPHFRIDAIPRAKGRWRVNKRDLAAARRRDGPDPDEPVVDVIRIEPALGDLPQRHPRFRQGERAPDPHGNYPTNPDALPPGLKDVPLVTLVQRLGPDIIGGFTWAIREEDED